MRKTMERAGWGMALVAMVLALVLVFTVMPAMPANTVAASANDPCTIGDVTVTGKVGTEITPQQLVIGATGGNYFKSGGFGDLSALATALGVPNGLTLTLTSVVNGNTTYEIILEVSGTPKVGRSKPITGSIPSKYIETNGGSAGILTRNPDAKWDITGGGTGNTESGGTTQVDPDWTSSLFAGENFSVLTEDAADYAAAMVAAQEKYLELRNGSRISPQAMGAFDANAKGLPVYADTTQNGELVGRLIIDPAKAKELDNDIRLCVRSNEVWAYEQLSEKYDNPMTVVNLYHSGSFGMEVRVGCAVDLSKLDTTKLHFYYNDGEKYVEIENPDYSIGEDGLLYFTTSYGDDIIIIDSPPLKEK